MLMLEGQAAQRSGCPINLTMEVLGDRWSLVVLRDLMFGNRRHFRALLTGSEEGIAPNILSARLKRLLALGLLTRIDDPDHGQRAIYSLTPEAIDLVPVIAAIGAWGSRHLPVTPALSIRAKLLDEGGPEMWRAFMDDLTLIHVTDPLGGAQGAHASPVLTALTEAYERVAAEQDGTS